MFNVLHEVFISPLVLGMSFIFVHAYNLVGSYGFAIVLLSVVVNILLLPMYRIGNTWELKEREKHFQMANKIAEIKEAFKGQERFMMLKTLYRQNNYHPIMGIRSSFTLLIQIPFFVAAYQLLSDLPVLSGQAFGPFTNLGLPDAFIQVGDSHVNLMPLLMTVVSLLSILFHSRGVLFQGKIKLYVLAIVFLVFLYSAPLGLVLYWTSSNVFSFIKNSFYACIEKDKESISLQKKLVSPSLLSRYKSISNKSSKITIIPEINSPLIYFSSAYLILFLISAYVPINFYLSDPYFFDIKLIDVVFYAIKTIVIGLSVFGLIYFVLNKNKMIRNKVTYIVVCVAAYMLFNILVPLRDYGVIDHYVLTHEYALHNRKFLSIFDVILLCSILCTFYFLSIKGALLKNKVIFLLINAVFTFFTIFSGITSNINYEHLESVSLNYMLPKDNVLNSYSQNKKNVVVFMLDTFTGDHVESIFQQYPDIKKHFTGFIWYPDTITTGSSTFISEPSIHGGYDYTVKSINARSENIDSLLDEIAKGYQVFNNDFGAKEFDVSIFRPSFVTCKMIRKHVNNKYLKECVNRHAVSLYFSNYMKRINKKIHGDGLVDDNAFLQAFALFSAAPYGIRPRIYGEATWLGALERDMKGTYTRGTYAKYAYLSLMGGISNTQSDKPTFKYITSMITHYPFNVNANLELVLGDPIFSRKGQLTKIDGVIPEHVYVEAFSLNAIAKWIKWLKDSSIYDNTMIVLVSDHGASDSRSLSTSFNLDVKGEYKIGTNQGYPGSPHGLLMVKDFHNNAPFSVSKKQMSSADVPSIVCSVIDGCQHIPNDPRYSNRERVIEHSTIVNWSPKRHPKNKYNEATRYRISGSMFNKENWKRIK